MNDAWTTIISSAVFTFIFQYFLVERLKHKQNKEIEQIRADNASIIEKHKYELERETSVLSVAHRSFGESLSLFQRERVNGISVLWRALLDTRSNIPAYVYVLDMTSFDNVMPSYEEVKDRLGDVQIEQINKFSMLPYKEAEMVRPFVGDNAWSLYYLYHGIVARIVFHYYKCSQDRKFTPWHSDNYTVEMVESLLTIDEKKEFKKEKAAKLTLALSAIERKFLSEAESLISGQRVNDLSVHEAARMARDIERKRGRYSEWEK